MIGTRRASFARIAAGLRRAILVALFLLAFTAAGSEVGDDSSSAVSTWTIFATGSTTTGGRYIYAYVPRWPTYVRDKVQTIKPPAQPCRFTTQSRRAIPSHRRGLDADQGSAAAAPCSSPALPSHRESCRLGIYCYLISSYPTLCPRFGIPPAAAIPA